MSAFLQFMEYISNLTIPVVILVFLIAGWIKGIKMYEVFVEGAKEGFQIAVRIIPYLVAIFLVITAFRSSGAMAILQAIVEPITSRLNFPADMIPLALTRPLSGSGALGITSEIIANYGPDSREGFMAGLIQSSTDTTFYVLAVYFGAVGIIKSRHALPCGLFADSVGILTSVLIANLIY